MAGLVHPGPERAQVVRLVARRHADVRARERGRERVHRRVEPPCALLEAEPPQHVVEEPLLELHREVAVEEGVVRGLARAGDDRGQLRPQHAEDGRDLRGRHPRLVLVQEGVVRRVAAVEALGPAERDLVDAPERRQEDPVVRRRARFEPGRLRFRALAQPRRGELGRDAPGLLPVAPGDADQAGVVGVVGERLLERRQPVEQPAGLVVDEALVDDPAERGQRLRARGRSPRRHHRALVPAQHAERPLQVVDLGEALPQLG